MTKQQHPFYLNPDFWRVSYVLSSREGTHIPTHLVHPDDTDLASKLQSEVCYYIVLILCVSSYSFSVTCGPHPQTLTADILRSSLCSQKVSNQQAAVYASSVVLWPVKPVMLSWSLRSCSPRHSNQDLKLKWHFVSAVDWLSHHDEVGIHAVTQWGLSLPHIWKPYSY